ncbi:Angiopoietin-4 [Dirofilaria immitis]|nr:Angiopoietin-4 [Dirofilaria immitis]
MWTDVTHLIVLCKFVILHCLYADFPLLTEYPGHIGGRCIAGFDCDPNGPRVCITLTAVRDCFVDCPNAADEECPVNKILCDSKISHGCGKCVNVEERDMQCSDRRWRNICSEMEHFKCMSTDNCVLPHWIGDGFDDCADGSDEDLCALQLPGCNQTGISPSIVSPFDVTAPVERPIEGCLEGEFRCITSNECISIVDVLDGIEQCNDGSDERYCKEMAGSKMCQKSKQCSFSPAAGIFTCDCPLGYSRTSSGIPKHKMIAIDMAEIWQNSISDSCETRRPRFILDNRQLRKTLSFLRSGSFKLNDWSCSKPEVCSFIARCEMNLFGGGWTIIMQRFNTSLDFNKSILEYENGFDLDNSNFWIGLERMHYLTSRPQCTNELLLRLRMASNGHIIMVWYSHFIVHEKLRDYRLNIGSIIYGNGINAANELAQSQLCPFVTSSEKECIGGGGWWRKGCQQKGTYPGLNWNGKRLSAVQMLIRPRGYVPPPKKPS